MSSVSSPAILLRRIDHGDYDLILTFLTFENGKMPIIAKSAKKSVKRFSGVLELFQLVHAVYSFGKKRGLPILQEATLQDPFDRIRTDYEKTAYASCWAELILSVVEERREQKNLFQLLKFSLSHLNAGDAVPAIVNILFQMRFLTLFGLRPNLEECRICKDPLEEMETAKINFDLVKGGLVCQKCSVQSDRQLPLSIGTVKRLIWTSTGNIQKALRMKFSSPELEQALAFVEAFVPFHTGKELKSLKFLKQIRRL